MIYSITAFTWQFVLALAAIALIAGFFWSCGCWLWGKIGR